MEVFERVAARKLSPEAAAEILVGEREIAIRARLRILPWFALLAIGSLLLGLWDIVFHHHG